MATEDLGALVLSSLESIAGSELCVLSHSLASHSSLQLRRLWLLMASPSLSLPIFSFLQTLSWRDCRFLLARVILRLLCRITNFLEDLQACRYEHAAERVDGTASKRYTVNRSGSVSAALEGSVSLGEFAGVEYVDIINPCDGGELQENDHDGLLPWGETDVAFLFLFFSETQERECQEALQGWCVDPYMYQLLIVQDMVAVPDDERMASFIKLPKWRERLQQYLLSNILQVGYGFPGLMASTSVSTGLNAYLDTIGRLQRLLKSMSAEDCHDRQPPPTSATTIQSLPTAVVDFSSEEKGRLCIICKEELVVANVASQLPCLHVYHQDCIVPWLKQRNNCPMCRHQLPTDDFDYELQRKIQILKQRGL